MKNNCLDEKPRVIRGHKEVVREKKLIPSVQVRGRMAAHEEGTEGEQ